PGPFVIRAIVPAGPLLDAGLCGVVEAAFVRMGETELVIGTEAMIEPYVELVAVGVVSISIGLVYATDPAREAKARRIQTVDGQSRSHRAACCTCEVVRQRHSGEQRVLNKTGRIKSRPVRIAAEH